MKKIRLERLSIDNFKGQAHLTLNFDGKSARIYGDNATGKTTLYDALTWLLFGKDSAGQGNFEVKPVGVDGQVLDHAAITSVEAAFDVAGQVTVLRKTYYEKWSTKRGSAQETYDGNTSDYFVDGVPSKKYEFERRVDDLVSEEAFRQLTGVTYFCGALDWRTRRNVLFDACSVSADRELLGREERFSPLLDGMGNLSLEDYKRKLQAERKGLVGIREDVPVRLDECQKTVEELCGIDFAALRVQRDQRMEQKDRLSAELLKLKHNALLDAKRNEMNGVQNQLTKLENENNAHRQSQMISPVDSSAALRLELEGLERSVARLIAEKRRADEEKSRCEAEVERCRMCWGEANTEVFGGAVCPTCSQTLVGELLDQAKEHFLLEQQSRLDGIVEESKHFKELATQAFERREDAVSEVVRAENRIAELKDALDDIRPVEQPPIQDLPEYAAGLTCLRATIANLKSEIEGLSGETASIQVETQGKIDTLAEEIAAIDGSLAQESVLSFTRRRMDTLRGDARAAAERLERLDRLLFLYDEFMRFKVENIEADINRRFRSVKFRLFAEQVNGGLAECCEATVDGVPYLSLNNGARINAGMDVISALSEHYGVQVPLFVDNAESVTRILSVDTQVILLMVSEGDRELRCEYEDQG